jgi:hypothetical protein
MIRKLLVIVALGALVSFVCFHALNLMGGFDSAFMRHGHGSVIIGDDEGPVATRDLPWTGSETLHIAHSAVVTYTQGPTPKFTVSGPKTRIDQIRLDGDTLSEPNIHRNFWDDDDLVQVTITSPNTHVFFLSGRGNLTLTNFEQDSLDLNLSGASYIRGVGHAKHATIDMSGAGRLDLSKMPVDDLKVSISGAASATVDPKQSADVSISGAGHVSMLTRPPNLHSRISGVGSITTPDGAVEKQDTNDRGDD